MRLVPKSCEDLYLRFFDTISWEGRQNLEYTNNETHLISFSRHIFTFFLNFLRKPINFFSEK